MKIGKNGLSRNQFKALILNLKAVADELKQAKQEREEIEKEANSDDYKRDK